MGTTSEGNIGITNEEVLEEIEALEAVYLDQVTRFEGGIVLDVTPLDSHLTPPCIELKLKFDLQSPYPEELPKVTIELCKGLEDSALAKLKDIIASSMEGLEGDCLAFTVAEAVRTWITEENHPHGLCMICMEEYSNKNWVRLPCFHFVHDMCLGGCIEQHNSVIDSKRENEILCGDTELQKRLDKIEITRSDIPCPLCRSTFKEDEIVSPTSTDS